MRNVGSAGFNGSLLGALSWRFLRIVHFAELN